MFAFRKIWCALFSCYLRFEINPFTLLPTICSLSFFLFHEQPWTPCVKRFPNTRKHGPEKTPYLATFHAVVMFLKVLKSYHWWKSILGRSPMKGFVYNKVTGFQASITLKAELLHIYFSRILGVGSGEVRQKWDVVERREVGGVSECSRRPILFFYQRKLDFMLSQTLMYYWQEIFLLTLMSDSETAQ